MLIRKTQQPSDYPENQIHDAYSTSTTDTYSTNYINDNFQPINNLVTGGRAVRTGRMIDGQYEYVKRFKFTRTQSGDQTLLYV